MKPYVPPAEKNVLKQLQVQFTYHYKRQIQLEALIKEMRPMV